MGRARAGELDEVRLLGGPHQPAACRWLASLRALSVHGGDDQTLTVGRAYRGLHWRPGRRGSGQWARGIDAARGGGEGGTSRRGDTGRRRGRRPTDHGLGRPRLCCRTGKCARRAGARGRHGGGGRRVSPVQDTGRWARPQG
eukprot:221350-Pleurochrysis_carterae.AAC.2